MADTATLSAELRAAILAHDVERTSATLDAFFARYPNADPTVRSDALARQLCGQPPRPDTEAGTP